MRFYSIEITHPETGEVQFRCSSLNADGSYNPLALRVNFDIPFFNSSQPAGDAFVRIYGVTFKELSQDKNFSNSKIIMYGGMSKGLPLAKPEQQGIILKGRIFQAFGNWQGTEVTLDLIVVVGDEDSNTLGNFSFEWKSGTTLTDAVKKCLQSSAEEQITITGQFNPSLISVSDQAGTYNNLSQLGKVVYEASKAMITDLNYIGAQITKTNKGYHLYDSSTPATPKKLDFTDFIGNATYTAVKIINFKLVLRGNLQVGDVITMPPKSNIANSKNTFTHFRNNISQQNSFRIIQIRHLGDSRQSMADNWCTVVDATTLE